MRTVGRPFHKLTPEIVRELREKQANGTIHKAREARRHGVNVRTIHYHVFQGKHLP